MNVASLELCKELYEVSGWNKTGLWWNIFKPSPVYGDHNKVDTKKNDNTDKHVVAYDLGYLIRKLPSTEVARSCNGTYWANYMVSDMLFKANTPEDAAALLAIELFKQGILKKL